jgi:hypothetical protein
MTKKGDFCAACGRDAEQEKDGSWAQYHFADCPHHPTRQALASRGVNPTDGPKEHPDVLQRDKDKSTHSADASRYTATVSLSTMLTTKLSGVTMKISVDTLTKILQDYYETDIETVKLTKQQVVISFKSPEWEYD